MKSHSSTKLSIALGALLLAATPGFSANAPNSKEVAKMAQTANSPSDHANVAKHYLDLSKQHEAKADKLEKELSRYNPGPTAAMEQKWPALMNASRERKERLAMQSRRAAQEARQLAKHHSQRAGRTLEQIASLD
jgi:hypothetical protein